MSEAKGRFWYSARQREWLDYCDSHPILGTPRPKYRNYALIDNRLVEYTEMCSAEHEDYDGPNFDDAVFLGHGQYACGDHNIQRYLKQHPEVRFGSVEEWPDVVG